jgi:2-iminobutanoate/2-iminopropanoate deaminase
MKRRIETDFAPRPIGPYSQAIEVDGWVWCAGQVGTDAQAGGLVEGGAAAEAERALRNLAAVLDAAGASFADVVKTTVFLADMADFAAVNEVYARFFPDPPPARSTFAVAALPRGARVEIEAVARAPSA